MKVISIILTTFLLLSAQVSTAAELAAEERQAFSTEHSPFGLPSDGTLLFREGYILSHNNWLKIPNWVAYKLAPKKLKKIPRKDAFRTDLKLKPWQRAELSDYRGSGLDRGHLAPAADMKMSVSVMSESFLLTNMAPQIGPHFNRGIWEKLESSVREWSNSRGELWVVTGPVFLPKDGGKKMEFDLIGSNRVAVPTHFFKIALDKKPDGSHDAIAFMLPHEKIPDESRLPEFIVSIDEIEKATGLDFFEGLPDDEEEQLESAQASEIWKN